MKPLQTREQRGLYIYKNSLKSLRVAGVTLFPVQRKHIFFETSLSFIHTLIVWHVRWVLVYDKQ